MKNITLRTGIAICILLTLTACKRTPNSDEVEVATNQNEANVEQPAAKQSAENDKAAPDKYRTASSALESEVSDSANKTICAKSKYLDSEDPSKFCECGDIIIPGGTECIDGMPACNGHKAVTAIPGFGCVKNGDDEDKY